MNENIKRIYEENKDNPVAWVVAILALLIFFGGGLWPLFILLPGMGLIYAAQTGERGASGLIFPGAIIAGTGALLLYQSITGHWASWAYAWTLYPVFVGMAMRFNGDRMGINKEVEVGDGLVKYGLIAFATLALMFEIVIFNGISLWLLLAAGIGYLWWNGKIRLSDPETDAEYRQKVRDFVTEKRKRVETAMNDFTETDEPRKRKVNVAATADHDPVEAPSPTDPYSSLDSKTRRRIADVLAEARETTEEALTAAQQAINGNGSSNGHVSVPVTLIDADDHGDTTDDPDQPDPRLS